MRDSRPSTRPAAGGECECWSIGSYSSTKGRRTRCPCSWWAARNRSWTHRGLADRLEEAIDGQRDVVVIEESEAQAFYLAVRTISVSLDRENLDWQRLLAELQVASSKGDRRLALADPRRAQARSARSPVQARSPGAESGPRRLTSGDCRRETGGSNRGVRERPRSRESVNLLWSGCQVLQRAADDVEACPDRWGVLTYRRANPSRVGIAETARPSLTTRRAVLLRPFPSARAVPASSRRAGAPT